VKPALWLFAADKLGRPLRLGLWLALSLAPGAAFAWGSEGHEIVAAIARSYLTPSAKADVDALLASDRDTLAGHDMLSESTWADAYRAAGHRETAAWHFVDIELDHPDLRQACFNFPSSGPLASQGPAQDCIVDKITAFEQELASPATAADERLLALKYLLHLVGDLTQPLHAGDNHDRGGNCVLVALGGSRTVNLHSDWDTTLVAALGTDPAMVAAQLKNAITPAQKASYERGDAAAWAMESYEAAKSSAYSLGSKPGCDDQSPVTPPSGYDLAAEKVVAVQLERAGVRLAYILNQALH
jgi:hypothetical protein